jgi:hypothetical protein
MYGSRGRCESVRRYGVEYVVSYFEVGEKLRASYSDRNNVSRQDCTGNWGAIEQRGLALEAAHKARALVK